MEKQTKTITLSVRQSGAIGRFYLHAFTIECDEGESVRDAWYRLYGDRFDLAWTSGNARTLGFDTPDGVDDYVPESRTRREMRHEARVRRAVDFWWSLSRTK